MEIGGHNTYFSLLGPSAKAFLAQHVCGRIFIVGIHKENDVPRAMRDETWYNSGDATHDSSRSSLK